MANKKVNHSINFSESFPELWEALSAHEREVIDTSYILREFKKNELIYRLAEHPNELFCVVKGKIKIYRYGVGGRSQIIRMIKPGHYFGYRAFFANEPYVTEASAFENSTLCCIPMELIEKFTSANSSLAMFFIKELAADLGIADERVVSLTQKHIRGRLAESLIFLIEHYGLEEDGATIAVYLSREDLASLSNMTTSNAIRTLSVFVDENILALDGRKIKVRDLDTLTRISKMG